MKICIINRMACIKYGGAENFDYNLYLSLKEKRHELDFIGGACLFKKTSTRIVPDIKLRSPYFRSLAYFFDGKGKFLNRLGWAAAYADFILFEIKVLLYLLFSNRMNHYDCYHLTGMPFLALALQKFGCKVVVRWPGPPPKKLSSVINKLSINIASGNTLSKCPELGLLDIPAGFNENIFRPTSNSEKVNRSEKVVRFVTCGRLVPIKRFDLLINAISIVSKRMNIHLDIIGDGSERLRLESIAAKCSVNSVTFHGELSANCISELYRKSDCFVLVSEYESFSMATIEAMACGLPVILSNAGYLPKLVNGNGYILKSNTKQHLAKELENLVETFAELSVTKVEDMSNNSIKFTSESYTWKKVASQWLDIVNKGNKNGKLCNKR